MKGTLEPETVKFLIVHHSASPNGYAKEDVLGYLSSFHALHTGPEKNWPDIAYNFFVDRFGRIFEGRTGSLKGPIIGSATGGNQGFSQLVCLLGDFSREPPSRAALASLSALLASIAARDAVSLTRGAKVSFVSRGSNKHRKGVTVTTSTIAGHRDMSLTACPGDACYALIRTEIAAAARLSPTPTGVGAPPLTVKPPATATGQAKLAPVASTEAEPAPSTASGPSVGIRRERPEVTRLWPVVGFGGLTIATAGGLLLRRRIVLQRAEARSFAVRAAKYGPDPDDGDVEVRDHAAGHAGSNP